MPKSKTHAHLFQKNTLTMQLVHTLQLLGIGGVSHEVK